MLTREKALELIKEYKMPENILRHTMRVNKIAVYLAKRLKESGVKIDINAVDLASLLHDLDKIHTTESGGGHGRMSYSIIKNYSPKIALIVRTHVLGAILNNELRTWEQKVVYYADKRVNGDKIVTLKERYDYLKERYGNIRKEIMDEINLTEPLVYKMEKEIFDRIKGKPEGILKI